MKPDITWKMRVIDPFISCKKIQAEVMLSNFQNEMTAYYLLGWAKFLNIYSLQCHFSLENSPIRNPPNQTINLATA